VSKVSWPALLARIRPHSRTLALSGFLALLGAAGGLAQPLAAREVIEALADDESLLVPLVVLGGLVLEAGQVRATGTHAELVRGDALYAELAATQFTAA
jgi:hypothetical protein